MQTPTKLRISNSRLWFTWLVLGLSIVSLAGDFKSSYSQLVPLQSPEARIVTDLPIAVQSAISAAAGDDMVDYHLERVENGYRASNPAHQLALNFDATGMHVRSSRVSWGLALTHYGYGDRLDILSAPQLKASGNRLEYIHQPGLVEWYHNGPLGLEHGYDLAAPPAADKSEGEPLTFALALDSPGVLSADRLGLALGGGMTYSGLIAWDADGRELPAWLELDGSRLLVRVDDAGARYPVRIDPWLQRAKLSSSDISVEENFGWSVAVSGETIVVGTYLAEPDGLFEAGAAYVFVRPENGWVNATPTAILTASNKSENDRFGTQVAIDDDVIVVGAPNAFTQYVADAGAAYVFVRPAGGWVTATETAILCASDRFTNDRLGISVSIDDDTIVVGAPFVTVGGVTFAGAVYVFEKPVSGWTTGTQTAKLYASERWSGDDLGFSVDVSGDVIVAGLPTNQKGDVFYSGLVHVFVKPSGGWVNKTQDAILTASDAAMNDGLGWSVSIDGDVIVAGAEGADIDGKHEVGAAYVYVKPPGGWVSFTETAKLTSAVRKVENEFGHSVSISGDVIVAGAYCVDFGTIFDPIKDAGAAYVFLKPPGGWVTKTENYVLSAADKAASDLFGYSVAVSGNTLVSGAIYHNNGGIANSGAAYVFTTPYQLFLPSVLQE